jgi:hypothetical protein
MSRFLSLEFTGTFYYMIFRGDDRNLIYLQGDDF